jgi:NAD(P)-dependent dehydrogenase (short-subunit alcohol dehydrogenase family)
MEGKIAVVTGASRGIGRAIARRLAGDGILIAVNYCRNAGPAEGIVREIQANGGNAFAIQADVGSVPSIREFYRVLDAELTKRTGSNRFDILVNNAGLGDSATISDVTEEHFDRLFAVNTKGPFFVTQLALTRLRDGGRIINISSTASRRPTLQVAPYSMTKAALNQFTLLLAAELGNRGITVNSVAPGYTATDVHTEELKNPEVVKSICATTALGRVGAVDDIAPVVAFLASSDSGWVTGQYIEVSGGSGL